MGGDVRLGNYTVFHLHSDLSSGVTNIDSVTKYIEYIRKAKSLGMKALAFSEHGSVFEWYHKKKDIEAAGMKYIHACECYVTENLDPENKVRDNYHCVLIARNKAGFRELNKMVSKSFNRKDGHFYYTPRISFEELINTSDNIIVSTACLAGILHKGNDDIQQRFLTFLTKNKHRCFLEIQHHKDTAGEQQAYNKKLYALSEEYDIPLIAGTDTHALNSEQADARQILQKGKNVHFDNEDDFDLKFKSYDELCKAYEFQGVLPQEVYLKAIENTNVMADMVEPFTIDCSTKYPKLYDDAYGAFKKDINESWKTHPYIRQRYSKEEVLKQVLEEVDVYDKVGAIDFMLLQNYLRNWEHRHGIFCGPGRGSVSGSLVAYILGITEMDSKKFGLNFFRFMNPDRVTNADIDTDYSSEDRDTVKEFILRDHMDIPTIKSAEIITFNTIKMKGAIKDIGRALGMSIAETQRISDATDGEEISDEYREKYPELFKYVDIVTGVIVSIGSHPSGVLVSDRNIDEEIGLCSLSTSDYPVSMLNMKELDDQMYVKLDILGLDNVGVINDTCKLAGIERITPDNIPLDDEEVWKDIRKDTTCIFQWESASAQSYLKRFMSDEVIEKAKARSKNFSWIKWFSFGNGLLRPGSASYRDSVANGDFYENGLKELDDFLAPTMGRLCMQEDIMNFLVRFCGYSQAESDNVRRCVDENTLVTMGNGNYKKIKDIKCGDTVLSVNEHNIIESKKVANVFDNGEQEVYKIATKHGNEVVATSSHKFLTQKGWVRVEDMTNNHCIFSKDAKWESIKSIESCGVSHVYDIEVEDNHNYIANNLIAHNCIAKKKGTEDILPEIETRFISYTSEKYGVPKEKCAEIIKPFLQVILDASDYSFSWNHSDAYSCIGYMCGYLRHYYPYEFITAALNIFETKEKKTIAIVKYAMEHNIAIKGIKFRYSQAKYMFDKKSQSIYKGMASIKYLNKKISNELYALRENKYADFIELLKDINDKTSVNSKQLDILIKLDFFSEFGSIKDLLVQVNIYNMFAGRSELSRKETETLGLTEEIVQDLGGRFTAKKVKDINMDALIHMLCQKTRREKDSVIEKIQYEEDLLGYINIKMPEIDLSYAYVMEVNKKFLNKKIKIYRLKTGETEEVKVKGKRYDSNPIEEKMIIRTIEASQEKKWKPDGNGGFYRIDEMETILQRWKIVK